MTERTYTVTARALERAIKIGTPAGLNTPSGSDTEVQRLENALRLAVDLMPKAAAAPGQAFVPGIVTHNTEIRLDRQHVVEVKVGGKVWLEARPA